MIQFNPEEHNYPCIDPFIRKKCENTKEKGQQPHEDVLQSLGDDWRCLSRPTRPDKWRTDGGHVELNSCTNTDILATGENNNNNATAEAQGSNEPTDPSSGDSAGGDITSSLIDVSIACGKDGDTKHFIKHVARKAGEKNRGTGEGVSGVSHGITKADERRTVRGGDGAEGDGDGAGFEEAAGVGADGLAEVSLQEGEREEAAVRLDLHLPGDTAGCCRCRFGLRRHLAARGGRRGVSDFGLKR
jgi:hypothetical protein